MRSLPAAVGLMALLCATTLLARADSPPSLGNFFQRLKAGDKQVVVVFGTSLTKDGAWVFLMQAWFDQKFPGQVTVVNSGGRGQNSDWGAAQVESQVLAHKPGLVFVEFSYNDAHQRFKLSPQHCRENLETIISKIQERDPSTVIVLQTMNAPWNPPDGKGFKDSETNRPEIEAYNQNYRACAREHSLTLVDNYPDWLKIKNADIARYQMLVPDGSHPSKAGSQEVTWANIRKLFEEAAR